MKVSLADIAFCFEGIVPAVVATCSKDGIPNASYLSHVFMVDEQHVATSFQFFNKTRANLLENPYAMIKVRNPINLQSYQLKLKYLRSEESGPVFENMSIKLDVIAAHEGMGNLFQLKAADIYEVIEAQATTTDTTFDPSHVVQDQVTLKDLELLRVISDKINELTSLEDVFDQSMQILNRYLGWTHMILLLAEPGQRTLITHSSFGYPVGGVGAEVKLGEGLIGICGQHRRVLQVGAIGESLRYAKAIKQGAAEKDLIAKISLPGLVNPASQIAAPLMLQNEFMGVFMIESETQNFWGLKGKLVLSTIANILALAIRALEGQGKAMRGAGVQDEDCSQLVPRLQRFRWVPDDELIFCNDQYLVKNIPARILWYLLQTYKKTGRTEFSNMELRAEKSLNLPELKDNLETRLILLRKRLEEQGVGIRLVATGRGKFRMDVCAELVL